MVETIVLKAEKRDATGTRATRKARAAGKTPGIIYGHKKEPVSVLLDAHSLSLELQHRHRLLEIEMEGTTEKLLVKDLQFDYLGDTVIHIDLTHVDMDERVQMTVELEFKGTPAGVSEGGVLDTILAAVELEVPVMNIPEKVRVSVADLVIGNTMTAGDIELPEGCTLVTPIDAPIAAVHILAEEVEVVEGEDGGSAEPEVIAREGAEEQTEE